MKFAYRLALRWGIVDVKRWLRSIEPAVLDQWIVFAGVEPEAFYTGPAAGQPRPKPKGVTPMMPAKNVGELFARLYR